MNFLYPNFLFALLAIAIPIFIHLFGFRKPKKIYFSNVQLLKSIEVQQSSRRRIKNILILLSRILAIVFLVFAFAKPYFFDKKSTKNNQQNIISIYIDNSYSMEALSGTGTLLDEAKKNAKNIIKAYHINDKFQILTNDFEGQDQQLLSVEAFLRRVDDIKISPVTRSLQEVMTRQEAIFSGSAHFYSYMISDFQKNFVGSKLLNASKEVDYSFVKLNTHSVPNVTIDSAWFVSPTHQVNASEKLIVRLHNYADENVNNVPIKLIINDKQKAVGHLNLRAGEIKNDTISFSGLQPGWQKASVVIKDYPLTFDDELKLAFHVTGNLKIAIINGDNQARYLKSLFSVDNYFDCTEMMEQKIMYNAFGDYKLIILNGLQNPSSGLAVQLRNFISNGGSVVIFPNLDADVTNYTSFLNTLHLPSIAKLSTSNTKVVSIDFKNPIFADVFENENKNIDLPEAHRYFEFLENNHTNTENLLQLAQKQLFFSKYRLGSGQIYLCATSLNPQDSNLPIHPLFVPLMYKIAFNSIKEKQLYYTIGKDNTLSGNKNIVLARDQSLQLKGSKFEIIPEIRYKNGGVFFYISDQIKMSGFYDLMNKTSQLAVYAFNQNKNESDMHFVSKNDLYKLFPSKRKTFFDINQEAIKPQIIMANKGLDLWKLCLILSILFLGIEIGLIRYLSTKKINTTA